MREHEVRPRVTLIQSLAGLVAAHSCFFAGEAVFWFYLPMLMFRSRARHDGRSLGVQPRSLIERYETSPSFEVAAGLIAIAVSQFGDTLFPGCFEHQAAGPAGPSGSARGWWPRK